MYPLPIRRIAALVVLLCLAAAAGAADDASTPNLQALKTDLLVVTAHPDDESMMAATMARYADEGRTVSLVSITRGEGGGNSTGKEVGASLGVVREAELRRCLFLLGTRHLYFLDQADWAYTESIQATFAKWERDETLKRLVRLVRLLRPTVVCTMDPAPTGGQHGHHQAAGRLATEAFAAAADPAVYPELIRKEGLSPWRARKLYWVSWGGPSSVRLATDGVAKGALAAALHGKTYAEIARAAESSHRSQGFDKFLAAMPAGTPPARPEGFLLVKSRVPVDPAAEKDLFEGTTAAAGDVDAAAAADPGNVLPDAAAAAADAVAVRLQPSAAVRDYRAWLRANGILRLLPRLPASVPLTVGAPAPVVVEVSNASARRRAGKVSLELPPGWTTGRLELPFSAEPHGTQRLAFTVTPPADARQAAYDVTTRLSAEGIHGLADAGKVLLLPRLTVKRFVGSSAPPVDARVEKYLAAGFTAYAIPPGNVAQGGGGNPIDAREISGRFFVGYDRDALQVLVDVTDDTVVANIAPDDIKAHWRTTSAEICVDPAPRSENTFTTLKLGIFPRDTAGRVRAARDADANPGPVDQTEPSLRLASTITPTGYVVEARIPWRSLRVPPGFSPARGRPLGFNVILYHAGKKDARVGEDVGKSRLAWSFWPGVWGRPEVWGTALLD